MQQECEIPMLSHYPDVMSIQQVQDALGVGRTTVYRLVRTGTIRSIRIGRVYRVPKKYLMDYILKPCYDEQTTRGLSAIKEVIE